MESVLLCKYSISLIYNLKYIVVKSRACVQDNAAAKIPGEYYAKIFITKLLC